jgi:hypothetical protein
MFGRGLRFTAVMHVVRRNEQDAIKTFHDARRLGHEEMDVVDRIEGSAENP